MSNESVFRFLAVRPANLKNKQVAKEKKVSLFPITESKSDLYKELEQAKRENLSKEEIVAIAKKFRETSDYVKDIGKLDFDVKPLVNWMETNRNKQLKDIDLHSDLQTMYGRKIDTNLKSSEFKKSYVLLADTILSDSIDREVGRRNDEVIIAFKLLNLLKRASESETLMKGTPTLGNFTANSTIVLPDISDLTGVRPDKEDEEEEKDTDLDKEDEKAKELERLNLRLKRLETAHRELSMVTLNENAITKPSKKTPIPKNINLLEQAVSQLKSLQGAGARPKPKEEVVPIEHVIGQLSLEDNIVNQQYFYLTR